MVVVLEVFRHVLDGHLRSSLLGSLDRRRVHVTRPGPAMGARPEAAPSGRCGDARPPRTGRAAGSRCRAPRRHRAPVARGHGGVCGPTRRAPGPLRVSAPRQNSSGSAAPMLRPTARSRARAARCRGGWDQPTPGRRDQPDRHPQHRSATNVQPFGCTLSQCARLGKGREPSAPRPNGRRLKRRGEPGAAMPRPSRRADPSTRRSDRPAPRCPGRGRCRRSRPARSPRSRRSASR